MAMYIRKNTAGSLKNKGSARREDGSISKRIEVCVKMYYRYIQRDAQQLISTQ